jgi:hypothetical protein
MATSHHREVIDDHINNSNWKKLIDLDGPPLTSAASELTEIMQLMLYLNTIVERFLGQCLVQQHLII